VTSLDAWKVFVVASCKVDPAEISDVLWFTAVQQVLCRRGRQCLKGANIHSSIKARSPSHCPPASFATHVSLVELLCSMCLVVQDAENLRGRKLFNVAEDVLRGKATIWSSGSLQ